MIKLPGSENYYFDEREESVMYALTAKGMQYMDQYTISTGIPSVVLMEHAARGLADAVKRRFPCTKTEILIVCGSGNNGGDAVAAGRWLRHYGYENIKMIFTGNSDNASAEFTRQVNILTEAYPDMELSGLGSAYDIELLKNDYDVIVDGMFGIGLNRPLDDSLASIVDYINHKNSYIVAVDIPSGLNATNGTVINKAIKADLTVTFGSYKTGMFFGDGRGFTGELELVDIGLVENGFDDVTDKLTICDKEFFDATVKNALVARDEAGHKGTFGTVGIVMNNVGMNGAGILAAKAAYRAGCGLVKVFCPSKSVGAFNTSVPEAVIVPYKSEDYMEPFAEFVKGIDVFLIGPGLKQDSLGKELVKVLLQGDTPLVIDAGALNILATNLKLLHNRTCPCVVTPHLGEMAKLSNSDVTTVDRNCISYSRSFSEKYDLSMVVKSDISLVSINEGDGNIRQYANLMGNSGLATAGSGDVLAGVIASLAAQGNTLNNSLLYGVLIHAGAADKFAVDEDSRRKMMAGDIIDNLF